MKKIYNLTKKDLEFLNEDYSMNEVTLEDFTNVCEEMVEDLTGTVDVEELESLYFWERVLEDVKSIENIRLNITLEELKEEVKNQWD